MRKPAIRGPEALNEVQFSLRKGRKSDVTHLGVNGSEPHNVSGTYGAGTVSAEKAEQLVNCTVCRKSQGWYTAPGSQRQRRGTSNLGNWGRNRGH